jgi:hypothetical protein
MSATYRPAGLAALRAKGYSSALFPTVPATVSPKRHALSFKLAMGRTVRFNLISSTWLEESPEGRMRGKLSPEGKALMKKQLEKVA